MKNIILLTFVYCAFLSYSQENVKTTKAIPYYKGDFNLIVNGSFPNWKSFNLQRLIEDEGTFTNESFSSIPIMGIRFEYFLSNELAFNVEGSYQSSGAKFSDKAVIGGDYSLNYQQYTATIGLDFHFTDFTTEKLDFYGGLTMSTFFLDIDYESTSEFYNRSYFLGRIIEERPIRAAIRIGARYKLKDNIALHLEVFRRMPFANFGLAITL